MEDEAIRKLEKIHRGAQPNTINYKEFLRIITENPNRKGKTHAKASSDESESENRSVTCLKDVIPLLSEQTRTRISEFFNMDSEEGLESDVKELKSISDVKATDSKFSRFLRQTLGRKTGTEDIHTLTSCFDIDGDGLVETEDFFRYALFSKAIIEVSLV